MRDKVIPAIAAAGLTALVTIGGGIFAFGQKLGSAEATAAYWRAYHESVAALSPECRPARPAP